jgi:hypothetical protein
MNEQIPTSIIQVEQIPILVGTTLYLFTTIPFFEGDEQIGCVPTLKTLQEIIQIIGQESVESFYEFHQKSVFCQLELLSMVDYRAIGVYPSMIELCQKMEDLPVGYYCYYKAIIYYCGSIFWRGNYSTKSQIKAQKDYGRQFKELVFSGLEPSSLPSVSETQDNFLERLSDYKDAKLRIDCYGKKLTEAAKGSRHIMALLAKRNKERESHLEEVHQGKKILKPPAICPICGEFIEQVTRFRSSCGSEKCKKQYKAIERAKERGSVSRELFTHLITKTGKGIRCRICTKKKKVLYTDKFFCFECLQGDPII